MFTNWYIVTLKHFVDRRRGLEMKVDIIQIIDDLEIDSKIPRYIDKLKISYKIITCVNCVEGVQC